MLYEICNAGRFFSRGVGRHPTRVIDSDELILVLQGELSMFEEERQFRLRKGEWLILHRGRRHGGLAVYPRNLSFFWLHFRDLNGWTDHLPRQGRAAEPANLAGFAQDFLNEQSRTRPDPKVLDLLFQLIFCELFREGGTASPRTTPLPEAARNYIRMHFAEPVGLREAAEALQCNPEYLGRVFHQQFRETFSFALNRRRIEKAAELLASGRNSIKETAMICGFQDPAYFRRKFRLFYNCTPGEFRRRFCGGHRNTETADSDPRR